MLATAVVGTLVAFPGPRGYLLYPTPEAVHNDGLLALSIGLVKVAAAGLGFLLLRSAARTQALGRAGLAALIAFTALLAWGLLYLGFLASHGCLFVPDRPWQCSMGD